MPELQGYPLHPFRLQEAHVGVAVMLAFIGQKLLVGHRRQFLTSHFTRRYPPSEISPHIHSAGSVAVLVNVETTPVQLHATLFPSGDPAGRGISSYLRDSPGNSQPWAPAPGDIGPRGSVSRPHRHHRSGWAARPTATPGPRRRDLCRPATRATERGNPGRPGAARRGQMRAHHIDRAIVVVDVGGL